VCAAHASGSALPRMALDPCTAARQLERMGVQNLAAGACSVAEGERQESGALAWRRLPARARASQRRAPARVSAAPEVTGR